MATNRSIRNNQLAPNATYLVRGKVGFSRVTRHTTDQEREKENARRTHPINNNYTNITLHDAQVLAVDPTNPTLEERYAAESLYQSNSYTGQCFSAMNQSRNLPGIGVLDGPNHYVQVAPEGELAQGLDVTLVMRVFKGKGNNGVSLDKILVNEPIRYYEGGNSVDKALSNFGITFQASAPVAQAATAVAATPATPVAEAPAAATTVNNFASVQPVAETPAAQATPEPAPAAGNPFSSYGAAPATEVTFSPAGGATTPVNGQATTFSAGRQY